MRRHAGQYLLFALCLAVFGAFMVWPIGLTLAGGFFDTQDGQTQFTLEYLLDVFRDPVTREGLVNSFIIAICVTLLCLLIAIPLAVLSAVLLILAFPDFEFWFLAWFGLVPLFLAIEREKESAARHEASGVSELSQERGALTLLDTLLTMIR